MNAELDWAEGVGWLDGAGGAGVTLRRTNFANQVLALSAPGRVGYAGLSTAFGARETSSVLTGQVAHTKG